MEKLSRHRAARMSTLLGVAALFAVGPFIVTASAQTTLRLSTNAEVGSDQLKYVEEFAQKVQSGTNGRLKINVYPANQLGDWTETHEQVMQGAIDIASQTLSTKFDKVMALTWFPYTIKDYNSAREAFSPGGYVFDVIGEALDKQDIGLIGVYAGGMGGAGFTKPVPHPRDPNARQNMKLRIWPGGGTHRVLMERFGFTTAPLPWAELYTGLQTGIVEGVIGGTAENQYESFKDITKMWIQYNDHFEPYYLVINKTKLESLPEEDQKVITQAAREVTLSSFDAMEERDQRYLQLLRDAGAEVVILSAEELDQFVKIARQEVWPKITDEIGAENMEKIRKRLGL